MAWVRLQDGRVRLVRTFRRDGKVRQAVFELPADPSRLRELAERLVQVAQRLELMQTGRSEPTPAGPVRVWRFLSPHAGLVLYGAPTPDGAARFVRGMLETTDPTLAEWLLAHPDHGRMFFSASPA